MYITIAKSVFIANFSDNHSFCDDYYVYFYKKLQFMGDVKLELKSEEFKVPKYIESDEFETVKFLWFTFKRRKKIINPAWEIIAKDKNNPLSWEAIVAKEAGKDVKDVIKSYQEKGYTVTVEELDLDREIQLIVKFNSLKIKLLTKF